ncbi:MAG: alpha/beta hydrolase [Muribaculaceae bacterium]
MRYLSYTLLILLLSACSASVLHRQADTFLRGMPSDLQDRQADAIEQAIAGDNSALQAVRHSRNASPAISANVDTCMLTPSLRLYSPKGTAGQRLPLLIYLHGGGWTFGSLNSCARFCDAIAASGSLRVLAVDYRLAPEHPYPSGLDDCCTALQYACDHADELSIDPQCISIGGDSSGGNLAIATALRSPCSVHSLLLFYPVTKAFADGSDSWARYGRGYGLDSRIMQQFNRAYTLHAEPTDSLISPGLCSDATLAALPPTLLVAAERDILRDQGREFAAKAPHRITRVELPYTVHLFITVPGQDAAFNQAVSLALDFLCPKNLQE